MFETQKLYSICTYEAEFLEACGKGEGREKMDGSILKEEGNNYLCSIITIISPSLRIPFFFSLFHSWTRVFFQLVVRNLTTNLH